MPKNPRELVLLDKASRALAQASTVDEIKDIRDKAEAARKYAQSAKLGLDIQNYAAEIKLRAERKVGELLLDMEKNMGSRGVGVPFHDESIRTSQHVVQVIPESNEPDMVVETQL